MNDLSVLMAKLSGLRKALVAVMSENVSRNRNSGEVLTRASFSPELVEHYFLQTEKLVKDLKKLLPSLYGDFQEVKITAEKSMSLPGQESVAHYSRGQVERLVRDIDQIFEMRANSELQQPKEDAHRKVFISHGRSNNWRAVQSFIEKDVKLATIELAQEASMGRTIIEKLFDNASRCDSAVIVMTGDDIGNGEEARVRENVMHEIGFFQGLYGRKFVVLLYEDGVNIPTNLSGVAYIPFPKDSVEAGFHVLQRELRAIYNF